jgi:hypothetical protein
MFSRVNKYLISNYYQNRSTLIKTLPISDKILGIIRESVKLHFDFLIKNYFLSISTLIWIQITYTQKSLILPLFS